MFFIVIGVIILALILLYIIGKLIKVAYTIERSEWIDIQPSTLWSIIVNHSSEKDWRNNVMETVRMKPIDGKPVWKEIRRSNDTFLLQTTESNAAAFILERQIIDNKKFGGTYRFEIKEEDGGSRLYVKQASEIYAPFSKIMYVIIPSFKSAFARQYLFDIKQRALHVRVERDGLDQEQQQ